VAGCRTGVNFYVFWRVITGLLEFALTPFGLYEVGNFNIDSIYLYVALINNFACCWAIYCLVLFYFGCEEDLTSISPLSKFLCIKAVVFFSWWQSVILVLVEDSGGLRNHASWTSYNEGDIAEGVQDFLICIEMLFIAIAHTWSFSYKEFRVAKTNEDDQADRDTLFARAVSMFDFRDIGQDVMHSTRNPVMPEVDRDTLAPLLGPSPRLSPGLAIDDPEALARARQDSMDSLKDHKDKLPAIEEGSEEGSTPTGTPRGAPELHRSVSREEFSTAGSGTGTGSGLGDGAASKAEQWVLDKGAEVDRHHTGDIERAH